MICNKLCTKCNEIKIVTNFHKNRRQKDGLHSQCKQCAKIRHAKKYAENSLRMSIDSPEQKRCYSCNESKLKIKFPLRKSANDGLGTKCKDCCKQSNIDLKKEVFNTLGGMICVKCKETEFEFLTIQHKNGGGREHRTIKSWQGVCFDILNDPNKFQSYEVLCANCNMIDSIKKMNDKSLSSKACVRHSNLKKQALDNISSSKLECVCCGICEYNKLCIDHIYPYEQNKLGPRNGWSLYKYIILNNVLGKFQILCYNCNQSKGRGDVCVHKRKLLNHCDRKASSG